MSEPKSRDVREAFLTALDESQKRSILVGHMAAMGLRIATSDRKAEAWVEPATTPAEVQGIYDRTYRNVRDKFPDVDRAKLDEQIRVHTSVPGLDFDQAYANGLKARSHGGQVRSLSQNDYAVYAATQQQTQSLEHSDEVLVYRRGEEEAAPKRKQLGPKPEVSDVAIHRAALQTLNASGTPFLVVGDVATAIHKGQVSPGKLEVWVRPEDAPDPDQPNMKVPKLLAQVYGRLNLPEGEAGRVLEQVSIKQNIPDNKIPFDVAHGRAVDSAYCDQSVKAVSVDDLVALKLAAAKTDPEINAAGELLKELRSTSPFKEPEQTPEAKPRGPEPMS